MCERVRQYPQIYFHSEWISLVWASGIGVEVDLFAISMLFLGTMVWSHGVTVSVYADHWRFHTTGNTTGKALHNN